MVRRYVNETADSSTSTSFTDLQTAREAEQFQEDLDFVQNYYQHQSKKRRQHKDNLKHRLWEAEERLSMRKEDYNCVGPFDSNPPFVSQPVKVDTATVIDKSPLDDCMFRDSKKTVTTPDALNLIDKSPMDDSDIRPSKPLTRLRPLRDCILNMAMTLDSKQVTNEPTTSFTGGLSSGQSLQTMQIPLLRPWFQSSDHLPPDEPVQQEFVEKAFPQHRTCKHSRLLPKIEQKNRDQKGYFPPYGIQLINDYKRWLQLNPMMSL